MWSVILFLTEQCVEQKMLKAFPLRFPDLFRVDQMTANLVYLSGLGGSGSNSANRHIDENYI